MRHKFTGIYRDSAGNVITSGTVSVYLAGTSTAAAVYTASTGGTSASYVTSSSTDGSFTFYIDRYTYAVGQKFKIVLSKSGLTSVTYDNVNLYDVVPAMIDSDLTISIPSDFATIALAMEHLKYCIIPEGITVTLSMASGTHTVTAAQTIRHPYGKNIKITGATPVSTTISSVGSITGSTGAWSIPITVANATGISTGQYAIVKNVTGTGDFYYLNGFWEITNVSGNIVTITNTTHRATLPTHTITGGDIVVPTTLIKRSAGSVFYIYGPVGEIANLGVIGTGSGNGISAEGGSAVVVLGDNVGVNGFSKGIYPAESAYFYAEDIFVSNCDYGLWAQQNGSIATSSTTISNGNTSYGIACNTTSSIVAWGSITCGNGVAGVWAGGTSNVYCEDSNAVSNANGTGYGFYASRGAVKAYGATAKNNGTGFYANMGMINAEAATAESNTYAGFYAIEGGSISASSSTSTSNGTNGYYAIGGYIKATSSTATSNTSYNYFAEDNGTIIATSSTATLPGDYDYGVKNGGWINTVSAVGSPTYYPAGTLTLGTSVSTTTVSDSRVTSNCLITLTPTTANAAAELASGNMYISAKTAATSFVITHTNSATTGRTFDYTITQK